MSIEFIVSSFLALVGIAIAIYFYKKNKRLKKLTFQVLYSTPLIEVKQKIKELKVIYEDIEINELYISVISIRNSGNVDLVFEPELNPQRPNEFIDPIWIDSGTQIVEHRWMYEGDTNEVNVHSGSPFGGRGENDALFINTRMIKSGEEIQIKFFSLSKPVFSIDRTRIPDTTIEMRPSLGKAGEKQSRWYGLDADE